MSHSLESLSGEGFVFRRRLGGDEADMDITPMIDITFLLLIFFLVASKMNADAEILLPMAEHGTAVAEDNSVILTIANTTGGSVAIYKGNATDESLRITANDPAVQEDEIVAYLERSFREEKGKEFIVIKADKQVKHREVARVIKAVGRLDDPQLYVAVREES